MVDRGCEVEEAWGVQRETRKATCRYRKDVFQDIVEGINCPPGLQRTGLIDIEKLGQQDERVSAETEWVDGERNGRVRGKACSFIRLKWSIVPRVIDVQDSLTDQTRS